MIGEDGKAKGAEGFQVRPIVDAGIRFTVRWARWSRILKSELAMVRDTVTMVAQRSSSQLIMILELSTC